MRYQCSFVVVIMRVVCLAGRSRSASRTRGSSTHCAAASSQNQPVFPACSVRPYTCPPSTPLAQAPSPAASRCWPKTTASERGLRRSASRSFLRNRTRSEEHTSELQSRENLVCRLLLEQKDPVSKVH